VTVDAYTNQLHLDDIFSRLLKVSKGLILYASEQEQQLILPELKEEQKAMANNFFFFRNV
jgi:hypothetical protein